MHKPAVYTAAGVGYYLHINGHCNTNSDQRSNISTNNRAATWWIQHL